MFTVRNRRDAGAGTTSRTRLNSPSMLRYPAWQTAFSKPALRQAWLAVRANRTKAQRKALADFERNLEQEIGRLHADLLNGRYKPRKPRIMLFPKGTDDWRPITLWQIRDRIVQRAAYDYLEPLWNPLFLDCSYGFRTGRSTGDAARAISAAYAQRARWVYETDIEDCFGSIDINRMGRLLGEWRVPQPIRRLIGQWLKAQVANPYPTNRPLAGVSQGNVLSPLLCNLYLHSFDKAMVRDGWQLVRYADDLVVLAQSQSAIKSAQRHAEHTLHQIGLKAKPSKTRLTTFEKGFQFVGWFFVRNEAFQLK